MITSRRADTSETRAIAELWHAAWHETQAPHVPDTLIGLRTMQEFEDRVTVMIRDGDSLRVAGPKGAPLGLCAIKADEMYQLFVSPAARGTGVAAVLLQDAEERLIQGGCHRAHLDCLDDNDQAKRFYQKQGWQEAGVEITTLDTSDGPFEIPCMIFRKTLAVQT